MSLGICFACAEFAPLAKAGGLADACAALAAQLHNDGYDLRVVMPHYSVIQTSGLHAVPVPGLLDLEMRFGERRYSYRMLEARHPETGVRLYLVDCPELYSRPELYGQREDEHLRFALLARATLDTCVALDWHPDIMHCHDWHTALVPAYAHVAYQDAGTFARCRTVLTIHNLGYQGIFPGRVIDELGLDDHAGELLSGDKETGSVNFLRSGITHVDCLTTVSPTYAREILTPEFGMGLEDLLGRRKDHLVGILNGVDYSVWDPAVDRLLPYPYSSENLSGKAQMKHALLKRLGLEQGSRPLFAQITRLDHQKGIDLLIEVLPGMLERYEMNLLVLGTGHSNFEDFYKWLAGQYGGKVRFINSYDPELAHWIEAGADIFLMPSRYEPCGLNQMYSLRYGTVPVVRRTGGLADSVKPVQEDWSEGTGFVFCDYDPEALLGAMEHALAVYRDGEAWQALMRRGMAEDFSWQAQGEQYRALYDRLLDEA